MAQAQANQATQSTLSSSPAFGVTSLVTGIVGLVFAWVPIFSFLVSVVAVVFGALGIKKTTAKGMSIAGLVTGGVSLIIGLIVLIFWVIALGVAVNADPYYYN